MAGALNPGTGNPRWQPPWEGGFKSSDAPVAQWSEVFEIMLNGLEEEEQKLTLSSKASNEDNRGSNSKDEGACSSIDHLSERQSCGQQDDKWYRPFYPCPCVFCSIVFAD